MRRSSARILIFIAVLILVYLLPWWLSAFIILGLIIYFPFYLEALFFGFLFDTLYSAHFDFPYIGLTIVTTFLLLIMFVKSHVRR